MLHNDKTEKNLLTIPVSIEATDARKNRHPIVVSLNVVILAGLDVLERSLNY